MVRNLELATDDLRHPGLGPDVSPEAKGLSPLGQQPGKLGSLLRGQTGSRTGGFTVAQAFHTSCFSSLNPLADRPFGNPHGHGDVFLLPTPLVQLPGLEPAVLPPIGNLTRMILFHGTNYYTFLRKV